MVKKVVFDYSKLNGKIREMVGTQKTFSRQMGMSEAAISGKLQGKTYFNQAQIQKAIGILRIEPGAVSEYFFTPQI